MKKTSKEYQAQIEETQKKIKQLEHREQLLENRMRYLKQKKRRQRTHRLITRGAAVESIVPQAEPMPETAFYEMMEQVLNVKRTVPTIQRREYGKYGDGNSRRMARRNLLPVVKG